jgi:group I intron endonuclease
MIAVYAIKCKTNNKAYIGVSYNVDKRWKQHKNELLKNKHHNHPLQNAYNKYGTGAFEYSTIYETNDYELARNVEGALLLKFFGKWLFNTTNKNAGFMPGNKICVGRKQSKKTIEKIVKARQGYKHTSESKAKISKALLGNTYTLGYKHTEEAKQKQREASRGNPTRFKPLTAYIKDGVTYLGSIEASIKTNIPRTTLMKHAKLNKNGWSCYRLTNGK